jgi:hypothetical protein
MNTRSFCLMCLTALLLEAKVINVEFHFSPYSGDAAQSDKVQIVAGKVRVLVNNVPIAERDVSADSAMVLFDDRRISGPIWITAQSLGPSLRAKGNRLRIEFTPADAKAPYSTQLRWAFVTDGVTRTENSATNMTGEGKEEKAQSGPAILERDFDADFAEARPWHAYPAITALDDNDRKALAAMVQSRLDAYRPPFAAAYKLLAVEPRVDGAGLRKARCVEKAHAAGMKVKAVAPENLDFVLTGNAEILLRAKSVSGSLYEMADENFFKGIKEQSLMRCLIPVLEGLFPQRMLVVKNPAGAWEEAR